MSDTTDINPLLESAINKSVVIFTNNNFVYNCRIVKVWGGWVQFLDLKKGYTKIIKISDIREVQFLK